MIETKGLPRARRNVFAAVIALAGVLAAPFANADTVLVEAAPLISGTQSNVYSLTTPSAGSVSVSLTNLGWPDRLASLSFALATSSGVVKTFTGDTQSTFDLSTAGTYYAIVTGTAQGNWNLGMYSLRMSFSTLAAPSPVPLPGSALLLFSGLVAFRLTRWLS